MISKNKTIAQNQTRLVWTDFPDPEWERIYAHINKANLLQSTAYGRACAKTNYQTIRQGIFYIDDTPAALLQILEAGFLNKAIHGLIVDRGPLWRDGFGSDNDFAAFLHTFRREFPSRLGRKIRFIPEIKNTPSTQDLLQNMGFKQQKDSPPYKTSWLNLQPDTETLKANLDKKWRNALNKSQKQSLNIVAQQDSQLLAWFLSSYEQDKRERRYHGPSLNLLTALIREFSGGKNALTLYAIFDETPIAAILLFIHGKSATYQIGYTSQLGREKCAHNALLWHAVELLKERNIREIDLGGIIGANDGLTKFKKNMGGKTYETPGLFIG